MEPTSEEILRRVRRELRDDESDRAAVYVDARRRHAGDRVPAIPEPVDMPPYSGYVVFADLVPTANWGHPAAYLFVSDVDDRVTRVDVQFPPPDDELAHYELVQQGETYGDDTY